MPAVVRRRGWFACERLAGVKHLWRHLLKITESLFSIEGMNTVITDDNLKANISANLHRIMEERDSMTRYRLAQLTGESEQTIRNVVDGLHVPRTGILARIAEALDVTIDDLIASPARIPAQRKSGKKVQHVA